MCFRKETRTIYLRNSTLLPVAWKLNGMDNLGDDFSVTVDNGLIEPKTEFALQMHFRAIRATTLRKIVRLEVKGLLHSYFSHSVSLGISSTVNPAYKNLRFFVLASPGSF